MLFAIQTQAVEFSAQYLLEVTTDLDDIDSNRTNFFGLGTFDLEKSLAHKDALFIAHNSFLWSHGESLSTTLGDVNGFSNISGPEVLRLNHLWLQYERASTSVRIGRFDIDEYFMAYDSGAHLFNSSFGALATTTANMPIPTYPVPGLAALLRHEYSRDGSLTVTIMDGDVGDGSQHDNLGFDLGSSGVGGLFLLAEIRHAFTSQTMAEFFDTQLMFGFGIHSGEFTTFENTAADNNALVYLGVEKRLFTDRHRAIKTAIRVSAAPFSDRNIVTYQADFALSYQGAFDLSKGTVSLGFVYADLSKEFAAEQLSDSAEWLAELNYRYEIDQSCFFSPSIQYINGGTLMRNDSVVGMLRIGLTYD